VSHDLEDFGTFWNLGTEIDCNPSQKVEVSNKMIPPDDYSIDANKLKAPFKRNRTTELLHATVYALKKYYLKYPPPPLPTVSTLSTSSVSSAQPNKKLKVKKERIVAAYEKKMSSSSDIITKANILLNFILKDCYSSEDLKSMNCFSEGINISIPSLDQLVIRTGGVFCGKNVPSNFVYKDSYMNACGIVSISQQAALLRAALLTSQGPRVGESSYKDQEESLPMKAEGFYNGGQYLPPGGDGIPRLYAVIEENAPGTVICKDGKKCCLPFKLKSFGLHSTPDDKRGDLNVDGMIYLKLDKSRILSARIWFDSTTVFEQLSRFNGN